MYWICCILFSFLTIGQFACTEKEEIVTLPPQPGIPFSNMTVGSGIDSLPLEATALPWQSGAPLAAKWDTRWICTKFPDGTSKPVIHQSDNLSAKVTGLAVGTYEFAVVFATKHGERKASARIEVVKDFPSGTKVVVHDLKWIVDDLGNNVFFANTTLYNRPDLFFFRGANRFPQVEYQDPVTGQWQEIKRTENFSFWEIYEGAYFNLTDYYLDINLIQGVTSNWKAYAGGQAVVRLTY